MIRLGVLLIGVGLLLTTACTSTKLTSSWKTPDARLDTSKRMIVVALVPPGEKYLRILMERELVGQLEKAGFHAVSSIAQYGPDAPLPREFRSSGMDQVLTVTMVDNTRSNDDMPPPPPFYRGWYGGMYTPAYYTVKVRYTWDTNLYDIVARKLIYNARSSAIDPPTAYRQASQFAKQIVRDMYKQQLFVKS
jgi:hypothetical protein